MLIANYTKTTVPVEAPKANNWCDFEGPVNLGSTEEHLELDSSLCFVGCAVFDDRHFMRFFSSADTSRVLLNIIIFFKQLHFSALQSVFD